MNQAELLTQLAERTGETKTSLKRTLKALRSVVEESVANGDEVSLLGICTVGASWRGPRVLRQVHNGRKLRVGGRFVPRLKPASSLRRIAAARTDQSWKDPAHQKAWKLSEVLVADVALYHKGDFPSLSTTESPEQIRVACEKQLGDAWKSAAATYARELPAEVRKNHDYLASAAVARWSK